MPLYRAKSDINVAIGDERPCQRCIKRGLADACQDGVRKKAKYLHDAPPEALRPVLGPNYNAHMNPRNTGPMTGGSTSASESSPSNGFFSQITQTPSYDSLQYQSSSGNTMAPPMPDSLTYNNQQSPMSASSFSNNGPMRTMSMQSLTQIASDPPSLEMQNVGSMFEAANPTFPSFNFDLEGLNFGNHYGALEFGMLNHMSSGAAETPPHDHNGSMSQASDSAYMTNSAFNPGLSYSQLYQQQDMKEFMGIEVDRPNNVFDIQRSQSMLPRAYAIDTHTSGSVASPSTNGQSSPKALGFEASPTNMNYQSAPAPQGGTNRPNKKDQKQVPKFNHQPFATVKPRRDPSSIYTSVTEPYAYTAGFHALTAFIQKRFSAAATLRIAKSLASIRPSFISCTKTLNRQDLIFMEQCFQRTLFEYQDFMRDCSTPTLVCRRTGEVAAVNSEFTMLVGWKEDVLLGKKVNLNTNTGRSGSISASAPGSLNNSGKAGLTTPRNQAALDKSAGKPRSVFLAELMDDDSVVEFYEDFAKLAFGDSRGSIMKRCKLLKYRPKDGLDEVDEEEPDDKLTINRTPVKKNKKKKVEITVPPPPILGGRVKNIDGKDGISRLVKEDGKLDCTYCWTVKRDVFDIPMLFVMNVSLAFFLHVLFF